MTDISPGNVVKLFCNQRCVRHVFFCFSHLKNAKNGFTRGYEFDEQNVIEVKRGVCGHFVKRRTWNNNSALTNIWTKNMLNVHH